MNRLRIVTLTFFVLGVATMAWRAGAQDAGGPPPQAGDGGQGGQGGPADQGGHHAGPPPGFHLLPRFVEDKLSLTDDQKQQVDQLEKETKAKLEKILTADQVKILQTVRPPHPRGGPGGPGDPGDGGQGGAGPGGGGADQGPPN